MKYLKILLLSFVLLFAGCAQFSNVGTTPWMKMPADTPNYRWMKSGGEIVLVHRPSGGTVNATKYELKRAKELQYEALKIYNERIFKSRPLID